MGVFKDIEEARAFFKGDHFATLNGAMIKELDDDACVCAMALNDGHRNARGGVMGGAIFMLADFAFAVLANNRHRYTVSESVTVHFLHGAKGNVLFAKASCRKDGRTTCIYNVDAYDDMGTDVAVFTIIGHKL